MANSRKTSTLLLHFTIGLVVVLMMISCANTFRINESWRSQNVPETTYGKLLIVAISADDNLRELYENIFVELLDIHGVQAAPSNRLIKSLHTADQAKLQELARLAEADAILLTRVVSRSEHTNYILATGSVQERSVVMTEANANSTTTVAMSAVGIVPGEIDSRHAFLETRLFDAASAELVWSANSEGYGYESKGEACWDLSILFAKELAKENLIKVNGKEFRKLSI